MKTPIRLAAAGALALALAACGEKSKPDPYLQNIPDAAALTIDTAAAAPSAAAVVGGVAVDPATIPTGASAGDDLAIVHDRAQKLNAAIRDVFAHVDALTSTGGQLLAGGVKQWGPAVRCVERDDAGACVPDGEAKLVLRARRWSDHLGDFVVLATSTAGGEYRPVLAGYLIRGAMERRGAGKVWVNHENLHAAAAGFKGRGYAAAGFAAGPVAKRVTVRMLEFTRDVTDAANQPAVTATFSAWRNGAGVVRARVAGFADLVNGPGGQELAFWRAVWAPARGGRAFTIVADGRNPNAAGAVTGDVDPAKYWFARACYDPGHTTASYKEWYLCDRGQGPLACIVASGPGTPDAAVGGAVADWAHTTCAPADASVPAEDRDELLPPAAVPHDGADDASDEDGAEHVGLVPEACPSTASSVMNPDQTPPGMAGPGMGGMM